MSRLYGQLLTLAFGFLAYTGHAQSGSEEDPLAVKVFPPGPEAASLGKYIDMPVGTYTGIPEIRIPVYELRSYQLALPLSLSYHASGIRMEEIHSFVAAGWSLNAGGLVSRTIRGLDDEHVSGYRSTEPLDMVFEVDPFFLNTQQINALYIEESVVYGPDPTSSPTISACEDTDAYRNILYAARGGLDLEPDVFIFSLPDGQSAKFLFDRSGAIHVIPKQYVNISFTQSPVNQSITSFVITGRNGTRYIFSDPEYSDVSSYCDTEISFDEVGQPLSIPTSLNAISTWKLTRMETANGIDWIAFEYEDESVMYENPLSVTTYNPVSAEPYPNPPPTMCAQITSLLAKRLKKITTRAGYAVEFYANSARADTDGGYMLDSIQVRFENQEIKTVRLSRSSITGSTALNTLYLLDEVQEFRGNVSLAPAYQFEYFPGEGFDRGSYAVDHWGYSNGATGNGFKAPAVFFGDRFFSGADREPNLEHCRKWALKKITYPTGGSTEYVYELHSYSNLPQQAAVTYSPGLQELGGISFAISNDIGNEYYDTATFILTEETPVLFLYEIPELPSMGIDPENCSASLERNGSPLGMIQFAVGSVTHEAVVDTLQAGSYRLTARYIPAAFEWSGPPGFVQPFNIRVMQVTTQEDQRNGGMLHGGGLRIRKIIATGDSTLTKTYDYTSSETGISSGKLMSFPQYGSIRYLRQDIWQDMPPICTKKYEAEFLVRTATSGVQLSQTSSSYVGYDEVTEYFGVQPPVLGTHQDAENNGYTVYRYSNVPDEELPAEVAMVPRKSFTYRNGLLKEQFDYTRDNRLVRHTSNTYAFSAYEDVAPGIKIVQLYATPCKGCDNRRFVYGAYYTPTELIRLTETNVRTWGTEEDATEEITSYYVYNTYDQVTSVSQLASDGVTILSTIYEYHPVNHTARTKEATVEMVSLQMKPKSGKKWVYDSTGLMVRELWLLATDPGVYTSLADNLFEKRLEYEALTPEGKIRQYRQTGNPRPVTMVWGYNNLYPIAQVINADTARVACTSFETPSQEGGWKFANVICTTDSVTGSGSYDLLHVTPVETTRILATGTYIIQYWSKGSSVSITTPAEGPLSAVDLIPPVTQGSWTLFTKQVVLETPSTVRLSTSGAAYLDELRLYPLGAEVSTATYDVATGNVTSQTDSNCITVYYVYDNRNRLQYIRDFEGNIVKRFEYHFQREN